MTVKSSALLWSFLLLASSSYAQLTGISVEEYVDHTTTGVVELNGMITYRVYVDCTNPADEISAVYGDATAPLSLFATAGFYQNVFGESFGWNINPAFFSAFAALEYDSWITIGSENNVILGTHNTVGLDMSNFDAGGDLNVDNSLGGSWFTLFGDPAAQAGDDLKVLIAQLTIPAGSSFTGSFNVQMFVDGVQSNSTHFASVFFSSQAEAVFGCMDPDATNYNADATEQGEACIYPCALSLSVAEVTGTSCPGLSDGEVVVTSTGQQLGVLFQIEGSDYALSVGNFNELAGGFYTITGTDGAGCVASIEVEIVEPAPIVISPFLTQSLSCSGDEDAVISGTSQGGTGALDYSLNASFTNSTNELYFDGLGPGVYNILAMDENGCLAASPMIVIQNPSPLTVVVAGGQDAIMGSTCADSEDGIAPLISFGGSGGAGSSMQFSSDGVNFSPGNVLFLNPGTYTFYVMDANGCIAETANEYTVDGPPPIEWGIDVYSPVCYGEDGVVYVSANGGNGGFTYTFEGQEYTGAFETFIGAGMFEVWATDAANCVAENFFEVIEPDPIGWEVYVVEEPACSNGFIGTMAMDAFGGTGGQYELFVAAVDFPLASSFEWNSGTGTHDFYLVDINGCIGSGQYTLEGQPSMDGFEPVVNEPTCFGDSDGSLMPDPGFDFTTWSVEWSGPSVGNAEAFVAIEDLPAGVYALDLTSSEYPDCVSTVSVVVDEPEDIFFEVDATGPNCPGELSGLIFASAFETQGEYGWTLNGVQVSDEPMLSIFGLSSGTFTLGVIDEVGCSSQAIVVLDAPEELDQVSAQVNQPTSFSNGSIALDAPEGSAVNWYDMNTIQIGEGNVITGLSSGTYSAMMTSAAGCSESVSYELDFAGCALTDALDWPLEAEGFFPTESAIWYLGQELMSGVNASTSEWILRIPDLITDGGINYPVVSFVLDSLTGLPPGINVELDLGAPMLALESRCVQFAGMPVVTGDYEVTLAGVLAIALFGTSFDVDGFSFSKIVSVQDNPETVMGCTYEWASNFNPFADLDDGSCSSDWGCPNLGACNYNPYSSATDINCDFTCLGCTYFEAENYNSTSTLDDGTCDFQFFDGNEGACFFDFDESGNVGATDLLMFLEAYGVSCQ